MSSKFLNKIRPFIGVIFLQFGSAGFAIVAKAALNQGSSHYVFSVYRNGFAALLFIPFALIFERKTRPNMTLSVFMKILLLGLLDPVIGQNMFYAGMRYTTATVTSALCNLIPTITFVVAWVLRIEKLNFRKTSTYAKILGTAIALGGAMVMTMIKGSTIGLPWTHAPNTANASSNPNDHPDPIKGALMIGAGCFCYALFYILQSITLKSYGAGMSLTAMICGFGSMMGTVVAFTVERNNTSIWILRLDAKLLAYLYGGVVSSGITYYLSGVIMKEKGPVFVTAFNPLSMVIVAILSSFIFAEQMTVGKVGGALVIVVGLYLVIWGKAKDNKTEEVLPTTQQPKTDTNSSSDDELPVSSPKAGVRSQDTQVQVGNPESKAKFGRAYSRNRRSMKNAQVHVVVESKYKYTGFFNLIHNVIISKSEMKSNSRMQSY